MNAKIKKMTYSAVFAAIIFLATAIFPIRLPLGGYVNMGDVFVLMAAVFLGPCYGAASAGLGSALADIFLDCAVYAPVTFVIKAVMAVVFCAVFQLLRSVNIPMTARGILASLCAEIVMVSGYFIFETHLYEVAGACAGIIANCLQGVFAVVAFCLMYRIFAKISKKLFS